MSQNFQQLVNKYTIKHQPTSPYNPTEKSISEGINGQINDIMRIYRGCNLPSLKEKIEIRLNLTNNQNTCFSPIEVVYGISPYQKMPVLKKTLIK